MLLGRRSTALAPMSDGGGGGRGPSEVTARVESTAGAGVGAGPAASPDADGRSGPKVGTSASRGTPAACVR
jgi:hypothetical protein